MPMANQLGPINCCGAGGGGGGGHCGGPNTINITYYYTGYAPFPATPPQVPASITLNYGPIGSLVGWSSGRVPVPGPNQGCACGYMEWTMLCNFGASQPSCPSVVLYQYASGPDSPAVDCNPAPNIGSSPGFTTHSYSANPYMQVCYGAVQCIYGPLGMSQ
jgi:hypothetical protein